MIEKGIIFVKEEALGTVIYVAKMMNLLVQF